jgi:peptide/nickel transport system substrate-binding protein
MNPPSAGDGTPEGAGPRPTRRHAVLAIVVAVVLVGAGGIAYLLSTPGAFSGSSSTSHSGTHSTCSPPSSPACRGVAPPPMVANVIIPFTAVEAGQPVPVEVGLPGYFTIVSNTVSFGDGSRVVGTALNLTHTYAQGGLYYVFSQVETTTLQSLTNLGGLAPVRVASPPPEAWSLGDRVEVAGAVLSNGTARENGTSILRPGGSVTLSAWIAAGPTNGSTMVGSPYYALGPGGPGNLTLGAPSGTGAGPGDPLVVTVTARNGSAGGLYPVSFVVPTTLVVGGASLQALTNYTFTVFVGGNATGGEGAALVTHTPVTPHPGTLSVYLEAPGGSQSEDPAIDAGPVGMGPILNVYQTLISYNGSSAGPAVSDFVPDLATCVPGGTQCASLYGGNTLLSDSGSYTFVINPAAQFYDPGTGAHYGVYPSDVVFSLARTCLFSTYPGYQVNPGWIQCQSLLPNANVLNPVGVNPALAPNPSWDGGLHYPLNNTPGNILTAMTVNSTQFCPKVNGAFAGNGCVTFNTQALTGTAWSYFLELIGDPLGASIMSCAWASANGGGIPGFTVVGDHCTVPAANSLAPTAWDSYMTYGVPSSYNLFLQWHMMGSGPYYLANLIITDAYYLQANPYWAGTTCEGGPALGCLPGPFNATRPPYVPTVNVIWESSATQGESAYAAGAADFASIPPTDTNFMLQLRANGTIGIAETPSLSISFYPFNMDYNVTGAQTYVTTPINTPGTILQDLNFRQFLINSFPYATIESTVNTVDGVQYAFPYGGAIPQYMGTFYPANISWPTSDPSTNPNVVGTAGYWWAQFQKDPIYQALSTGNGCMAPGMGPCILPLMDPTDNPIYDIENQLFANEVLKLSGGAIEIIPRDLPLATQGTDSSPPPGQNPMPIFTLGWAPDYPDPTDYMAPLYQPDSTYTFGDAVMEGLASSGVGGNLTMAGQYYGYGGKAVTACADGGTLSAPNGWNMVVTLGCQGWAYVALANLVAQGAACAPSNNCSLAQRELIYNNAEHIADKLGLYIYNFQVNSISTYASWINPAGINTNPMIGGLGDQTWYTVGYVGASP